MLEISENSSVYTRVRAIILPVFVYECETSSLTLREERRLGVFGNRVS